MNTMLVASTGGHLAEMLTLRPRLPGVPDDVVWVTFDTPQSRSLLDDQNVAFVPFTAPRDMGNVLRNLPRARALLREYRVERVISTGSAIALSFLPPARLRGIECHYVESAARTAGPSATGRLLSFAPGVRLYSQYPGWAGGRWHYGGSVFDSFTASGLPSPERPRRIVVTLGTMPFPFGRLVGRLRSILPDDSEVLWQTGVTPTEPDLCARANLPAKELGAALADADAVISHAGVGSALAALQAGKFPVLVPRELAFGEHVDDHQRQIAADLADRGLAIHSSLDDLTWEAIESAAALSTRTSAQQTPFRLAA